MYYGYFLLIKFKIGYLVERVDIYRWMVG
jgi:hypothetical protein